MLRASALIAALALAALPANAAAAPTAKPGTKADWTRTFGVTPEGGFRMGNPRAKVAIVEYASLTCPHCRHFAETAMKPLLDQYVRTGRASYEYRSFILNGVDLAATLVSRCNGPSHFFPMAEQLYATQPEWAARTGELSKAEQDQIGALPQGQMMLAIAKVSGLLPIAASHGIPSAKAELCLKDEKAAMGLVQMEKAATDRGVRGTPTFFVNGKQVAAYDWPSLEPFLKEAGG
jgi:protein-disulfide isomerase